MTTHPHPSTLGGGIFYRIRENHTSVSKHEEKPWAAFSKRATLTFPRDQPLRKDARYNPKDKAAAKAKPAAYSDDSSDDDPAPKVGSLRPFLPFWLLGNLKLRILRGWLRLVSSTN